MAFGICGGLACNLIVGSLLERIFRMGFDYEILMVPMIKNIDSVKKYEMI